MWIINHVSIKWVRLVQWSECNCCAVALEQRCIVVDRQCRESEGKVKIEGYMSISDEEAHQRSLVGDGRGRRNRVDIHCSDSRGSRNRVDTHCIAQERSNSWGGWIHLIDRHRGLRFANVTTAEGSLESILTLGWSIQLDGLKMWPVLPTVVLKASNELSLWPVLFMQSQVS